MTKKFLFVLMISSLILFFSCGSTKQNSDKALDLEPSIEELEESAQEETTSQEGDTTQTEGTEQSEQETLTDDTSASETAENEEAENIDELYPPLEEIEDPMLIDISPEEIAQAEAALAQAQAEQNETQITEPVEEDEELPPLPSTEENQELQEGESGEEGTENAEASEEQEQEPVEPIIEIKPEDAEPEIVIVPSRSVSLKKGETLVITYPGNGWIYMGSTSEYNNLASRGRKLGTTDTKYTLLAKEAGTQIHHFYKVDNLTGEYIDDYIEVTVLEKKGNSSTVVNAPDYSQVVPKKPETPAKATPKQTPVQTEQPVQKEETKEPAAASTATPKKEEVIEVEPEETVIVIDEEEQEETLDLEPLIKNARSLVSSKKYDDAYPVLIQYLEFSTDNRDEALYLLGQVLESNSKYRDIKQAVDTYQTLCDSYPASQYWENANKRIVYLKRFYINIH